MKALPLCLALLLSALTLPAPADDLDTFKQELDASTTALSKTPDSIRILSHRGDCYLFLAAFGEAVADFEKTIALDPAEDAPHWRLGIAYYFNRDFAKSSKQFAKYHAYDGHDRENGVWKFLADARAGGVEKARTQMLEYTAFDREPFPALYEMFAGKKTGAEVLAEMEKKGLGEESSVQFFANYYVGLNEELLGRHAAAVEHVKKAVAGFAKAHPGATASNYMYQVARVHLRQLESPSKP